MADILFGSKENNLVHHVISPIRLSRIMKGLSDVLGPVLPLMTDVEIMKIVEKVRLESKYRQKKIDWRPKDLAKDCRPCARLEGCAVAQMYGACRLNCKLFKEIKNEKCENR